MTQVRYRQDARSISDFSSVLLQATEKQVASADNDSMADYEQALKAMLDKESGTAHNLGGSHLSKILDKIRDNGPAGKTSQCQRRPVQQRDADDVVARISDEAVRSAGRRATGKAEITDSRPSASSSRSRFDVMQRHLPWALILVAVMVMAVMQYQASQRLDHLAGTMEYNVQGNGASLNAVLESQQQIASINLAMQGLTERVEKLGKRLAAQPVSAVSAEHLTQLSQRIDQQIKDVFQQNHDSIEKLRQRLLVIERNGHKTTANAVVATKASGIGEAGKPDSTQSATDTHAVSETGDVRHSRWRVNLAALGSRQQARKALQRLHQVGVDAMIEETMKNDKKLYRVFVEGFDSKQAAGKFVNRARQYGFDKGWIRQS